MQECLIRCSNPDSKSERMQIIRDLDESVCKQMHQSHNILNLMMYIHAQSDAHHSNVMQGHFQTKCICSHQSIPQTPSVSMSTNTKNVKNADRIILSSAE